MKKLQTTVYCALLAFSGVGCTVSEPDSTASKWKELVNSAQPFDYYFYHIEERDRYEDHLDTSVFLLGKVDGDTFTFYDLMWAYDSINKGINDIRADFSLPSMDDLDAVETFIDEPIVMDRSEVEQDIERGVFVYIYRAGAAPEGIPLPASLSQ